MIPDPVLAILAGAAAVTCGVCVILAVRTWLDDRFAARRFAEMQKGLENNVKNLIDLKQAIEDVTGRPSAHDITKKIVPIRPESA